MGPQRAAPASRSDRRCRLAAALNTADGDVGVVDLRRVAVEEGLGERPALGDRDRRQVDAVGAVADRVDAVDRRCGSSRRRSPRRSRSARRRPPPGRGRACSARGRWRRAPESASSAGAVVAASPARPSAFAGDRRHPGSRPQVDAAPGHLARPGWRARRRRSRAGSLAADELRDLGAQRREDAGELDRDVAAADDDDAPRQRRQVERFVGGDGKLDAGDRRQRPASRRSRSGSSRR